MKLAGSPLGKNERGLVIAPFPVKGRGVGGQHVLDMQALRFALLFWDRIDYPSNTQIGSGVDPSAEYLMAEGILQRSRAEGHGDVAALVRLSFEGTFRLLDERDPGRWSLMPADGSLFWKDDEVELEKGFLFELHRAIPVPQRDVAFADILAFKAKRQAELLALRHHLERIYQAVRKAPERPLAQTTELEALDKAITDHVKALRGSGIKWVLGGLQAKLDLRLIDGVVGAGLAIARDVTLTGTTNALSIAGTAAAYSLSVSAALRRRASSDNPFEYVTKIYRDL